MIKGKLGKRPPVDKPALQFIDHLETVPSHPLADKAPNINYPMDLNDRYGDCVVAGADHTLQVIDHLLGVPRKNWTSTHIINLYKTQNPDFDPHTDAGDNGMVIQDFLAYLVQYGYILGFAKVDIHNESEVKAATYLGLALMVGQNLTQAQEEQQVWDHVPGDPEIGGHCTSWVGYLGRPDQEQCVTWGELIPVTQNFIKNQVDECWFVLTKAHVDHPDFRSHYDLQSFAAAYTKITGRPFPVAVNSAEPPSSGSSSFTEEVEDFLKKEWAAIKAWAKENGLD